MNFFTHVIIGDMLLNGKFLMESIPRERLERCLDENRALKGYLQGYVAEEKLRDQLEQVPGLSAVKKIPDRHAKKGDFSFLYKKREYTVELKSLTTRSIKKDHLNNGTIGVVQIKRTDSFSLPDGRKTVCLSRDEFDILAVSTVAVDGNWGFKFILNKYLPSSDFSPDYIKTSFVVNTETTPLLRDNILDVLADLG